MTTLNGTKAKLSSIKKLQDLHHEVLRQIIKLFKLKIVISELIIL
ncbi:hypothetical protein M2326_003192 [Flavobacterium sp. 7A]|nr:hypothetical protein [Flavobacterium sp. 7A]